MSEQIPLDNGNRDNQGMVVIRYRTVVGAGLGYLVLPICIFFLTWLRWYIGIPAAVILLVGGITLFEQSYAANKDIIAIPKKHLIAIAAFLAIWVWTTGVGNFFVSAYDHPWRTAIFRDLINYKWPVIYPESGHAMVYYLCYWMVPALAGKVLGWTAGNLVLLLWTYAGVILTFLILNHICRIKTAGGSWCAAVLLFGWSGLNIVGSAVTQILNINLYPFSLNSFLGWLDGLFNGYSFNFFYRTNEETLMEIYNQAAPLWIATLLALDNKKNIQNYAFLGLCLLPFAPLPFLGLAVFMLAFFTAELKESVKCKKIKGFLSKLFSIQNICAAITVFPIMLLFYTCNTTTSQESGGGIMMLPLEYFDKPRLLGIVLFWVLEFGVIAFLIHGKYRHNYIFKVVVGSLLLCPLIEFGKKGGRDFCMNASLPALFMLMYYTVVYLNEEVIDKKLKARNLFILCVLGLSILSPVGQIAAELDAIGDQKTFPIVNDWVYTLSDKDPSTMENFLVADPEEKHFYKYLAK